jgi:hypothetical protein
LNSPRVIGHAIADGAMIGDEKAGRDRIHHS